MNHLSHFNLPSKLFGLFNFVRTSTSKGSYRPTHTLLHPLFSQSILYYSTSPSLSWLIKKKSSTSLHLPLRTLVTQDGYRPPGIILYHFSFLHLPLFERCSKHFSQTSYKPFPVRQLEQSKRWRFVRSRIRSIGKR